MNQYSDRMPPSNQEAERIVLGSLLRNNHLMGESPSITTDSFYSKAHQTIYSAISGLYGENRKVDLPMLANFLHDKNQIDDIGGYRYIGELFGSAPTSQNFHYYANEIKEKEVLRRLIHASTETLRSAYEPTGPASEVLEQAEQRIFAIGESAVAESRQTLQEILAGVGESIDARHNKNGNGSVFTGYQGLDGMTGGFAPGQFIVVAARPSKGKTALGTCIAMNVSRFHHVLFCSLEQSRSELAERMLCCAALVDLHVARTGALTPLDADKMTAALRLLRKRKLEIDDSPYQTMFRIGAIARRMKSRGTLDLIVIDYLQLVHGESKRENRQEQVANIARAMKRLAREMNVPVLSMAQLNRSSEERADKRPQLSDLRESGSIEQDADTVILLHPTEAFVECIIAKQRNGPTGSVRLVFLKEYTRFEDYCEVPR